MTMYKVLYPSYCRDHFNTGFFYIEWQQIGIAVDMADAKRRYGGAPVLELMRGVR